jgi:steroid 5-alpha reductase family enzyme
MNLWPLVLIAAAALSLLFLISYLIARKIDNYGLVDVIWTYSVGAIAGYYALLGPGWPVRRALLAAMVVVWSLRLGTHILVRVVGHHPSEDKRYQHLRKTWAANLTAKMLGFFQMQAASILLLSATFLPSCFHAGAGLSPWEIAGVILWLIAISGEALADAQLAAFKRTPEAKAGVCDLGLWHYSRHPNYFFEWLNWTAYFVFALASPWGWVAFIGPASILYLLLRVTGIPMTEEQSLRSRGDAYRRYQKTTSAFVPWPPKRP